MSSEPKAVGYVNGDGLNELKAGKAAGITVGIYSQTLPRTTPLYDEQALSALRAEVEKLSALRKHHRARHKSYKRRFNDLSAEVEALRQAIKTIAPRFRSGNSIKVEGAYVPREEWEALTAAMEQSA